MLEQAEPGTLQGNIYGWDLDFITTDIILLLSLLHSNSYDICLSFFSVCEWRNQQHFYGFL